MFDTISWFAPLINVLGLFLAVLKKKEAFLVFTIANVYWFIYHIVYKSYHFCPVLVLYQIMNTWGYIRWRKEEKLYKN